jgi:hypothetical protein
LKTIKTIIPVGLDAKMTEPEKQWKKPVEDKDRKIESIKAFSFYNYYCSAQQAKVFVETYIENLEVPFKNSNKISSLNEKTFFGPVAWLCRMSSRGWDLSEKEKKYVDEKISFLISSATPVQSIEKITPVVDIQKRTEEAVCEVAGELEGEIDNFILSNFKSEFNPYDFLKKNNIKSLYAKRFVEIFTKSYVEELKQVLRKTDDQLNEGYSMWKPAQIKKLLAFVQKIIDDSRTWADNIKKSKAPRKKKVKSADKLIQRLKYIKNDTEFNLVSVDPIKLIGSSEVWIFNVKTRRADHYISNGPAGISVKGSTLQNFNEETSMSKTIRKPLELAKSIATSTARAAIKYFDGLKTKSKNSNGRLNTFSLILRIV